MKNIRKLFIICFLTLLIVSSTKAQINPVYRIMKQRGWISPLDSHSQGKGIWKITSDQIAAEERVIRGYDDTTITNLQKINVDLLHLRNLPRPWNDKVVAALSDCIIVGTVSRIEHPFKENFWYHTVAYVQVEEFLRNDYKISKGLIPILIVSGAAKPGETIMQAGEDTLGIGEHVLLFLSATDLIEIASHNHLRDWYNQLINDSTIKFEIIRKFDMGSAGKIISRRRERSFADVKDDIKTVLTTIHRNLSTSK